MAKSPESKSDIAPTAPAAASAEAAPVIQNDTAMAKAVAAAIEAALPVAVGVGVQTALNAMGARAGGSTPAADNTSKSQCNVCRQPYMACGNRHRMLVVYPLSGRYGEWFEGVFINGVKYLSNNTGHQIVVPADSPIENMVAEWDKNEDELRIGRRRQHQSGSLGAHGQHGAQSITDSFFR